MIKEFQFRLNETLRWCSPRLQVKDPKYCLRSKQLQPKLENPKGEIEVWPDREMVDQLVGQRSEALAALDQTLNRFDSGDLGGGRLLLHFFGFSNHNGLTSDLTGYFFDYNDTPPWDSWVMAFYTSNGRFEFLISWVPREFVVAVDGAIEAECLGMLMWAGNPIRVPGCLYPQNLLPPWLTGYGQP